MADNRPIGVLDSGVGGISVLSEIRNVLPHESVIYFADSQNCPYGTKSLAEIREITKKAISFLIEKDCKLVVIACNSITSTVIKELREKYNAPFVGIEPATLVAARETKNNKIGVLATKNTIESRIFKETRSKISSKIDLEIKIGEGIVELVEKGEIKGDKIRKIICKNLAGLRKKGVDQVALGCTHYPFLIDTMKEIAPEINFINPALAVAKQIKRCLGRLNLESEEKEAFYDFYFSKKTLGLEVLIKKVKLKNIRTIKKIKI